MNKVSNNGEFTPQDYATARKRLEEGLREKGKLPELMKYEAPKKSIFGDPFSKETMAELAKLPRLTEDLNELKLISVALDNGMRDEALQFAKIREKVKGPQG